MPEFADDLQEEHALETQNRDTDLLDTNKMSLEVDQSSGTELVVSKKPSVVVTDEGKISVETRRPEKSSEPKAFKTSGVTFGAPMPTRFGLIKPIRRHIALNCFLLDLCAIAVLQFGQNIENPLFPPFVLTGLLWFFYILLFCCLSQFTKVGRNFFEVTDGTVVPKSVANLMRGALFGIPLAMGLVAGGNWLAIESTIPEPAITEIASDGVVPEVLRDQYSTTLDRAYILAGANASTCSLLAERAFDANLYAQSRRFAAHARSLYPLNEYYVWQEIRAMLEPSDSRPVAREALNKALSRFPENGSLYALQSHLERLEHNFDAALVAANRHVQLHNKEVDAYEQRAALLDAMGRFAERDLDDKKVAELTAQVNANKY